MSHFDARSVAIPLEVEADNMILCRNLDATKNNVSIAAQTHFSHRELQNAKECRKAGDAFQ